MMWYLKEVSLTVNIQSQRGAMLWRLTNLSCEIVLCWIRYHQQFNATSLMKYWVTIIKWSDICYCRNIISSYHSINEVLWHLKEISLRSYYSINDIWWHPKLLIEEVSDRSIFSRYQRISNYCDALYNKIIEKYSTIW